MKTLPTSPVISPSATVGSSAKQTPETGESSFLTAMKETLNKVNQNQSAADDQIKALASGQVKDLHQTMIAIEKADVSFRLLAEIRNKVIEAYREIMRMQI